MPRVISLGEAYVLDGILPIADGKSQVTVMVGERNVDEFVSFLNSQSSVLRVQKMDERFSTIPAVLVDVYATNAIDATLILRDLIGRSNA